jgi:hypothetical protein
VAGTFDDGSRGVYWVGYPDALTPEGPGANAALQYPRFAGGAASIAYDGSAGGGKVVFLGFPFETILSATARNELMGDTLRFFSRPPRLRIDAAAGSNSPLLTLEAEPGFNYHLELSTNLAHWSSLVLLYNQTGILTWTPPTPPPGPAFFRARLQW